MKMKLKIIILFSVFLLTACVSMQNYSDVVHSWRGASINELMNVWGYPNRIERLPGGHRLYIYRDANRGRYPVYTTPSHSTMTTRNGRTVATHVPTTTSGGGIYDLRCTTWFETNRRHRIVGISFRGNDCVATKKFVELKSRPVQNLPSPKVKK